LHYFIVFHFTGAVINRYRCMCVSLLSLSEVAQSQCAAASLLCLNFDKSLSNLQNMTFPRILKVKVTFLRHRKLPLYMQGTSVPLNVCFYRSWPNMKMG